MGRRTVIESDVNIVWPNVLHLLSIAWAAWSYSSLDRCGPQIEVVKQPS